MKPTSDPRRELLEDLFSPSEKNDSLRVEDVLDLVRRGKKARDQRKRAMALSACAVLAFATLSSVWMSRAPNSEGPSPQVVASTTVPSQEEVPKVERVNDERALALLDSTPSALIEWPDGRRTLMILVSARR